jgi:Fic-DOC domain mobile mystery protein B
MAIGPQPPGATPVREEDRRQLKPKYAWIELQSDLNDAEASNIRAYEDWATRARPGDLANILTDSYLQKIHRQMFGDVWKWGGKYRTHDLENEFSSKHVRIREDMLNTWRDIESLRDVSPQERVVRLHHRIVKVHPFTNGNGRVSRAIADFILERQYGAPRLPWGAGDLRMAGNLRDRYIAAIQRADRNQYDDLIAFCTS